MSEARGDVFQAVNRHAVIGDKITPGSTQEQDWNDLLDAVEDERAHAEAEKLRASAERDGLVGGAIAAALLMHASRMDPYEERDGNLVRKSDGKEIVGLKPGERHRS